MKYFLVTPVGFGAISRNQIFHAIFPESIIKLKLHINALELFSIVVAVHIWGGTFQGKKILIFCDNEASVKVINSGSSKDAFMQDCLRELCYMAAVFQFDIKAKHILGEENRLVDFLSRWQTHKKYAVMFNESIAKNIYEEIKVEKCHFRFLNNW